MSIWEIASASISTKGYFLVLFVDTDPPWTLLLLLPLPPPPFLSPPHSHHSLPHQSISLPSAMARGLALFLLAISTLASLPLSHAFDQDDYEIFDLVRYSEDALVVRRSHLPRNTQTNSEVSSTNCLFYNAFLERCCSSTLARLLILLNPQYDGRCHSRRAHKSLPKDLSPVSPRQISQCRNV